VNDGRSFLFFLPGLWPWRTQNYKSPIVPHLNRTQGTIPYYNVQVAWQKDTWINCPGFFYAYGGRRQHWHHLPCCGINSLNLPQHLQNIMIYHCQKTEINQEISRTGEQNYYCWANLRSTVNLNNKYHHSLLPADKFYHEGYKNNPFTTYFCLPGEAELLICSFTVP
jgi:hypothetical protein